MGRRLREGSSATNPTSIPVTSLAHNPRNARDDYDDVAELADSLREFGVLQPLGVVRYEIFLARWPEHEQDIGSAHWVVMQGNRRLAAARQAGLDEVPVVVQERLGRADRLDESILVENVHREGLPPLREAALLQELVDKHRSQTAVAKIVSKSVGWVNQRLSLLNLHPQLQAKLSSGELTATAARDLARIPRDRQLEAAAAGEPYRDPVKHQAVPTDENATPSDTDFYGVKITSTDEEPEPPVGDGFYDVKTTLAARGRPTGRAHGAAAREDGRSAARLITALQRRTPDEVAAAIHNAFASEEVERLAHLLRRHHTSNGGEGG